MQQPVSQASTHSPVKPIVSAAHEHIEVIEPQSGWRAIDIKEIWRFRELIWTLASRDIRVRYKQTVIGIAWAVLQPVMLMTIFTIFFGRLANMPSNDKPYPVLVFAGLLPWTFFASSISLSANSLVNSASLVSKVYFPRLIIPLASIGSCLVDFVISFALLLIIMLWFGVPWSRSLLAVPLLLLCTACLALGVGVLLSALNVAYRDLKHAIPFVIQIWMFTTPVIYPSSIVPPEYRWLLYLNPMTGLVDAFRSAVFDAPFQMLPLAVSVAEALVLLAFGVAYFRKVERSFADVI